MNYLLLVALLVFIIGIAFIYMKRDDTTTKPKSRPSEEKKTEPRTEEKKTEPRTEEKTQPTEEREFNELTDCINPTIIDDGECYKNTTGRWKINQIKTFVDQRCRPIRIVDDCPSERIPNLEYDCSPDEKSFCSNPVGQLQNCKQKRTPVTTDAQDLDLVKLCGFKGLMSNSEYKNAQNYFTSKGLTLPDLPNVNCTDFSQEAFCTNPVVRMENCRFIQTTPNTDAQDLQIIRNCGANSNAISDAEYKKAQEYFSAKGLTLPNRPTTNCMDNSTQNFCKNPGQQAQQCKFIRNTTDEEDFKRAQACYAGKIRSELTPEELQNFEVAKQYFSTLNRELLLPDVNCMDKSTDNYCKNPVSQMTICQKLDGNNMTKEENLRLVQTCARNNKITSDEYAKTQAYLKTQGVDLPNMSNVNCTDLSLDAYCKKPVERIQFCNDSTPSEQQLKTHLENIMNCKLKNKITADDYKQAQSFFTEKNLNLPNLPDVNCLDESEETFCKDADKILQHCGNIRMTNPEQYASLVRKCAYNGVIKEQTYNDAKTFLKTKNIELPQFPNVVCSQKNDDEFCKRPASYLQHCNDNSTLKQDLETTRICGILGKTSPEEYKKAQEFFTTKGKRLIGIPDVDCKKTDEESFCANPNSYITYCGPMRNKTFDQDRDAIIECVKNNKISKEQYEKVKNMFDELADDGKVKTLPNFPNVNCKDLNDFCKDPISFIEFCNPQANPANSINYIKSCKIEGRITDETYKSAQTYFKNKGLVLPSLPAGVNCKTQTTDSFCKSPVDHITYCDGTGIGDFSEQEDFNRVRNCVLEQNISPIEHEKAKAYFNSRQKQYNLPNIPDVKCSDATNTIKFCTKPTSYIKSCDSVRDVTLDSDFANVIECMKNNQISQFEYDIAAELFKQKLDYDLPPYSASFDCTSIGMKDLCKDPMSVFQKCSSLVSDKNKDKTKDMIFACSKQNLITKDKYNEAKTILINLPDYEPFDCNEAPFCKDPVEYIKNCISVLPKTAEQYKKDIINCVNNKNISNTEYDRARKYLNQTTSVVLPPLDELNADCANICTNPVGTLKSCKDRKFTLDQEVQQINNCIFTGKVEKNAYDQVKTYLDQNKDKLKESTLLDFKFSGCKNNCVTTSDRCNNLPFCLECSAAQNLNDPLVKTFKPSPEEFEKGKLCSINEYPQLLASLNQLNEKYPEHFKYRTKTEEFSCDWECDKETQSKCLKVEKGHKLCDFTNLIRKRSAIARCDWPCETYGDNCRKSSPNEGMCEFEFNSKPNCLLNHSTIYVCGGNAYASKSEAEKQCVQKLIKYTLVTNGINPCSSDTKQIFLSNIENPLSGNNYAYLKFLFAPNEYRAQLKPVNWIVTGL